jgi:hypothetical protein
LFKNYTSNILSSALKEQRKETAIGTGLRPMKKKRFCLSFVILCFHSLAYSKTIKSLYIAVCDEKNRETFTKKSDTKSV